MFERDYQSKTHRFAYKHTHAARRVQLGEAAQNRKKKNPGWKSGQRGRSQQILLQPNCDRNEKKNRKLFKAKKLKMQRKRTKMEEIAFFTARHKLQSELLEVCLQIESSKRYFIVKFLAKFAAAQNYAPSEAPTQFRIGNQRRANKKHGDWVKMGTTQLLDSQRIGICTDLCNQPANHFSSVRLPFLLRNVPFRLLGPRGVSSTDRKFCLAQRSRPLFLWAATFVSAARACN